LEAADPTLNMASLSDLALSLDFVVIFNGSDLASSCSRAKFEVFRRALGHNKSAARIGCGVFLVLDGHCAAHVIHRETERCFQTKMLIPKLYATAWSVSMPSTYSAVVAAVESIVVEDLRVGFMPRVAPPADLETFTSTWADLTLLRCKYLRAQFEDGDHVPDDALETYTEFVCLLNGDHRVPCIQHYCHLPGCCGGQRRDVAAQRIVPRPTTLRAWLASHRSKRVPPLGIGIGFHRCVYL
jgi:hypothetical protein